MCTMRNAKDSRDLHQRGHSKKPEHRFHAIKADKSVKSIPMKVAASGQARKLDTVRLVVPAVPSSPPLTPRISSAGSRDRKSGKSVPANGAGVPKPSDKDKTPENKRPKWAEQLLRGVDPSSPLPRKARMTLLTAAVPEAALPAPESPAPERVQRKLCIHGATAADVSAKPVMPLIQKRQLQNGSGVACSVVPTIAIASPTSISLKSALPDRKSPLPVALPDRKSPLRDRHMPSSNSVSDGCADALDSKVRAAFGFGAHDPLKIVRTEDGCKATSRPSTADSTSRWSWQKIDIPVVPVTEIKVERKKGSAPFSLPPKYIRMASSRAKFDKAEWSNDQCEYDHDEDDLAWLRTKVAAALKLTPEQLEDAIDTLDKSSHADLQSGHFGYDALLPQEGLPEEKCSVCATCCSDETNMLVYCDGCNVGVHQNCYGLMSVPSGKWYCDPCRAGDPNARCAVCPVATGALKRARCGAWMHVVCALWLPEVSFAFSKASRSQASETNTIGDINRIDPNRFKLRCSVCHQVAGACIQCYHRGCYTAFHVSCARYRRCYMSERVEWDRTHPDAPVAAFGPSVCYCVRHTRTRRLDLMRRISAWTLEEFIERTNLSLTVGLKLLSFLSRSQAKAVYEYWVEKRARHQCYFVRRLQASVEEAVNVEYSPFIPYALDGKKSITHTRFSAQAQKRKRRQQLLEEADGGGSAAPCDESVGWVGTPRSASNHVRMTPTKKGSTPDPHAAAGASPRGDEGSRKWFASSFLSSAIDEIRHIADKVVGKGRSALGSGDVTKSESETGTANRNRSAAPERALPKARGRPPKVGRAAAVQPRQKAPPHHKAAAQRRE